MIVKFYAYRKNPIPENGRHPFKGGVHVVMASLDFVFPAKTGTKLMADTVLFQNTGHSAKGQRMGIQIGVRRVEPERPQSKIRVDPFQEFYTQILSGTITFKSSSTSESGDIRNGVPW